MEKTLILWYNNYGDKMRNIIYLIRHTEIEKNPKTINENLLLSHYGEDCAEKLARCEELKNLDEIYSSTYMRAKETAEYIAYESNIEVMQNHAFDERKIGERTLLVSSWKKKPYSYTVGQMLDGNLKDEGGESRIETSERFCKGFNEIVNNTSSKKIAIVSHGAAIKFFLMNYCSLDKEHNLIFKGRIVCPKKLDYPSIVKIVINNKKIEDIFLINTEEKI